MSRQTDKKAEQLGMNHSTAQNRLRKDVMFSLMQKCNMDTCFQCNQKILTSSELSLEHKIPWLDSEDPLGLFFDTDNIAFSHLSCNAKASRGNSRPMTHGTISGYDHHKCRCELCLQYKKEYMATKYTKSKRQQRYVNTGN